MHCSMDYGYFLVFFFFFPSPILLGFTPFLGQAEPQIDTSGYC